MPKSAFVTSLQLGINIYIHTKTIVKNVSEPCQYKVRNHIHVWTEMFVVMMIEETKTINVWSTVDYEISSTEIIDSFHLSSTIKESKKTIVIVRYCNYFKR